MVFVAAALLCCVSAALAQVKLPNPITFYVGYSPGGSFDATARIVSKYLGHYLPGQPNVLVKYMPGGGTRVLAGYLFSAAKHDGSEFGQLHSGVLFKELFTGEKQQIVPGEFSYIGSLTAEREGCFVWHAVAAKDLDGARARELAMGVSDPVGTDVVGMRIANKLLGTKFKPIPGYVGGTGQNLAIERGELDGRCWDWSTAKSTKADWIRDHKIRYLLQMSLTKNPELPDVPFMLDLISNASDREAVKLAFADQETGYPLALPPQVPAAILSAFRDAFEKTMRDPDFLQDARMLKLDIDPVSGGRVQQLVVSAYGAPDAVVERARNLMWK
jgi:tripartite-type tricarboxylate transporter receptor subunit TctC